MERIVALYRLKNGVSMAEYVKWSLETDQPITSTQPGVIQFDVYKVNASGEGSLKFDVMEDVLVESWEAWEQVAKQPAMKKVADEWPVYCDGTSVLLTRVEQIK
jgi:hypothetical protein